MSLISWFQLFQLHFIIISIIIPTGLKILREERLDHLNYPENWSGFCLCCCVNYSLGDLVEIAAFGCRLNYARFNVRFNLLKNDFTRHHHLPLLLDIIITITVVVLVVIVILISKIIITIALSDMSSQSWVNWRKDCTCLCRVKQSPST